MNFQAAFSNFYAVLMKHATWLWKGLYYCKSFDFPRRKTDLLYKSDSGEIIFSYWKIIYWRSENAKKTWVKHLMFPLLLQVSDKTYKFVQVYVTSARRPDVTSQLVPLRTANSKQSKQHSMRSWKESYSHLTMIHRSAFEPVVNRRRGSNY